MLEIVLKIVLPMVLGGVISAPLAWVKARAVERKAKKDALEVAVKALAHDAFYRQCKELQDKDIITEAEHENLTELYNGYKALGLNGTGEALYKSCSDKKIRQDG